MEGKQGSNIHQAPPYTSVVNMARRSWMRERCHLSGLDSAVRCVRADSDLTTWELSVYAYASSINKCIDLFATRSAHALRVSFQAIRHA